MPATNPFSDDPVKAEIFELGYLAGFQDPQNNDGFPPLAPDLLDIYFEGAQDGRNDAGSPPAGDTSQKWVAKSDLAPGAESSTDEALEHLVLFTTFKMLEEITGALVLGLVELVITAVGIEGNVSPDQLRPLPDGFSEQQPAPDRDSVFYIAACPRKDHVLAATGVSADGLWSGTGRHGFKDALGDALQHGHAETLVARLDTGDLTCSAVWLAQDANTQPSTNSQ
jgi:hypothetical protein